MSGKPRDRASTPFKREMALVAVLLAVVFLVVVIARHVNRTQSRHDIEEYGAELAATLERLFLAYP